VPALQTVVDLRGAIIVCMRGHGQCGAVPAGNQGRIFAVRTNGNNFRMRVDAFTVSLTMAFFGHQLARVAVRAGLGGGGLCCHAYVSMVTLEKNRVQLCGEVATPIFNVRGHGTILSQTGPCNQWRVARAPGTSEPQGNRGSGEQAEGRRTHTFETDQQATTTTTIIIIIITIAITTITNDTETEAERHTQI
jgi:hypothetical protein